MAETSWETYAHRRSRLWKWPVIILLAVLVAGIIIHNNRDVISGVRGAVEETDPSELTSDSGGAGTSVPETVSLAPHPPKEPVPRNHVPEKRSSALSVDGAAGAARVGPVRSAGTPAVATVPAAAAAGNDSVIVGEVPCAVANRKDIVVRVVVVVYCDKAKRAEVMFKRDALAVVIRNAIRSRDLESLRFDALKPELLSAMNLVFDAQTIDDIAVRSVKIEKAFYK